MTTSNWSDWGITLVEARYPLWLVVSLELDENDQDPDPAICLAFVVAPDKELALAAVVDSDDTILYKDAFSVVTLLDQNFLINLALRGRQE